MFCQLTLFHYQKRLAGFLTWLGPFLVSQSFVAGKESERSSGLPPGRNSLRFKGGKKDSSVMSAGDSGSYLNQS